MAKLGNPGKLTEKTKREIVKAIASGNHPQVACEIAGIGYSTFREWMQRGEGTHAQRSSSSLYVDFAEEIKKAIAQSELVLVAKIQKASKDNWTAAAWLLERRFPERWSNWQKVQVEVKKEIDALFTQLENNLQPEVFEAVVQATLANLSSDRSRNKE